MLMPKRVKRRKQFRGSMAGKAMRGNTITYGEYGIVALEPCWIKSNQIEAARIAMTRYTKRGGKVWIKIFPDKPVTKTPAETRMGKGKGALEYWVAVVKPGRVMFHILKKKAVIYVHVEYAIGWVYVRFVGSNEEFVEFLKQEKGVA